MEIRNTRKQNNEILNGLNKRNLFVLIESGEKNN